MSGVVGDRWVEMAGAVFQFDLDQLLPIEEPVAVFALALTAFLIAPILIERAGIPGIVGIVLAGTFLGPNGTGLLDHSDSIVLLGTVGLVYLLFIVGLELDLRRFFNAPEDAALFGLTSFTVPLVVGTGVCIVLLGLDPYAALLLSAVFASHTLIAYPIVNKLDITKNPAVTAVFGGILFTDTLALVILALVLGAVDGGLTIGLVAEIALGLAILFGGLWIVIPPVARWFFRNLSQESYFEFLFVAALLFGAATLAEVLGLAAILGAFVAGLALNRQIVRGGTLMNRLEFLGNALFIPFFLLHVGMLVDPGVMLAGPETILVAAVIIGVLIITKAIAAGGVAAIQGYSRTEFGVIYGLSVGQAAAALAITLLGFEAGLFDTAILNAVVVMMLVTAVISPSVTERFGRRLAMERTPAGEAGEPYDPRILLPLSRTAELERRLLELAFSLKDEPAETPVHLLTVLPPSADDEALAEAESNLEAAASVGSAAEVPIRIETRVNHNVASGIIRTATETRADVILMGWDAAESVGREIFGGIIDQVRRRSNEPIIVSRLGRPINTSMRALVVLPPGVIHHDGFFEAIYLTKRLVERLGIEMIVYTVGDDVHQILRVIDIVEPEMEIDVRKVDTWSELGDRLESAEPEDLIVPIKPRRGSVGWDNQLVDLPSRISEWPPEAFVIVTPRQGDPGYASQYLRIK